MKFKLKASGALCSLVGPGAAVTCNIVAAIRSFVWNCSKAPETPSSCLVAYETLSEGVQHTEDIFYVSVFFAADDHETDYEFGIGSDDDDQIGDGEPR